MKNVNRSVPLLVVLLLVFSLLAGVGRVGIVRNSTVPIKSVADNSASQLAEDADCHVTTETPTTTTSCQITTHYSDEIAVLQFDVYTTTNIRITTKDSQCTGNWATRYSTGRKGSGTDFIQFCRFPNPVTDDTVTVTLSKAYESTMNVFTVVGANYSSPFESHSGALQATGNSKNPSTTINTNYPYDFVFAQLKFVYSGTQSATVQSGFDLLGNGGTTMAKVRDEGSIVTTALSDFGVGFNTGGASVRWLEIVDKIQGVFISSNPTTPNTMLSQDDSTTTSQSSQHKTFWANGEFWYIVKPSVGPTCQTSQNGQQFSSLDYLGTTGYGTGGAIDAHYNPNTNTLYAAYEGVSTSHSWYLAIGHLPTSNPTCGGITWKVMGKGIPAKGYAPTSPSITWDTKGNTWISLNTNEGNWFYLEVWECASNCGSSSSWTQKLNYNTTLPYKLGNGFETQMGLFQNGDVWAMYGQATNGGPLQIFVYNATSNSWTQTTTLYKSYTYSGPYSGSAINLGNTLYVAEPDIKGYIHLISCSDPCSVLTDTNLTIPDALTTSISTDNSSELVISYTTTNQTSIAYIKSTDSGVRWSSPTTLATGFSGISVISLTASFLMNNGNVTLMFTDGTGTTSGTYNTCVTGSCNVEVYYYKP